jgi:hypothetical protein
MKNIDRRIHIKPLILMALVLFGANSLHGAALWFQQTWGGNNFDRAKGSAVAPGGNIYVVCICPPNEQGNPGKKYKKATKMVDVFVFIVGVSELRKFTKIQLVLGSFKNI